MKRNEIMARKHLAASGTQQVLNIGQVPSPCLRCWDDEQQMKDSGGPLRKEEANNRGF